MKPGLVYLFRTSAGRWHEYRGWLWHNLPPNERWATTPERWAAYLARMK